MKRTTKKTARKRLGKSVAPSERDLREAAFDCADLAAAAERLGVPDLKARLDRSKRLAAAWDRGRLLRRVREVAREMYVVVEAADKLLGLPKGEFAALYAKDRVVRDLWDANRFELLAAAERGLAARVLEGDVKAIAAVEHLFGSRATSHGSPTDFGRLKGAELRDATGILREQWLRWVRENGCPQNADSTFSMPRLVEWLRKWERDQVTGGKEAKGLNPLQTEKAELLAIEKRKRLAQLVEITIHLSELANRAHALAGLITPARAHEMAQSLAGKEPEEIEPILRKAFDGVLDAYKSLSPDIPIGDEARAKIEEGLKMILEGTADERR